MSRKTYKDAYDVAKLDLIKKLQQRDLLEQEIEKLRQTVKALGEVCGADPEELERLLMAEGFAMDSRLGFTEAIRRLFRLHKKRLSPLEIREDLLKIGVGRGQTNLLASIHTVLRRMAENGEIEKVDDSHFVRKES